MVKKVLGILVIAFAAYYLFTDPTGAADAVGNAFDAVIEGFGQVARFFQRLAD